MRLGILGPLTVADDAGVETPVSAPRHRTLLAALLVRANRVVPVDELAEIIWDGAPPSAGRRTVRSYAVRLRHAVSADIAERIVTRDPGYQCSVTEDELDVLRFEALCRRGGVACRDGAWREASVLLADALSLWRGVPLGDVRSQRLHDECVSDLQQQRAQAIEWRAEAELRLGRPNQLIPELRALVTEHPMRESAHANLMLALYRCGRQAEALAVYQQVRQLLVDELGVEPGRQLSRLQQQILADDPALAETTQASKHDPIRGGERAAVPSQLPAAIRHFCGRTDQLATLTASADQVSGAGGAVVMSVISGTAGVGKTALAVHWAHHIAGRFPDGQLYADLRGFDPSESPLQAATVIRRFLDALSVPVSRIPADLDAQVDLYRSTLTGKRLLIVLDNARDPEQLRPLLPGAASCLVLITSRAEFSDLIALDGAVPLTLDLLGPDEARELLVRRLGNARVAGQPAAAEELIALCAGLPLALNIVSARAAATPRASLAEIAEELRDSRRRLDLLSGGIGAADLRAVFSWSFHAIGGRSTRMFGQLGLLPGPDLSVATAASVAGVSPELATATLRELTAANLLTEHWPRRYLLHDLLRAYASEQAQTIGDARDRHAAVARMLDHYLHTAHGASRLLYPARDLGVVAPPVAGVVVETFASDEQALAWFDGERAALVAAAALATREGFESHAWQIASALAAYLERGRHWHDYVETQTAALGAAQRSGELAGQATAQLLLGRACARTGSPREGGQHLHSALNLYRSSGDKAGQAHALHSLGWMLGQQGRHQQALWLARRALTRYREAGHRTGEARTLNTIGWYSTLLGQHQQALSYCQQALELHGELGNHDGAADAWDSLGHAHHQLGQLDDAIDCYRHARSLFERLGDRYQQADTSHRLGDICSAAGQPDPAREAWQRALNILSDLQHADANEVRSKLERAGTSH